MANRGRANNSSLSCVTSINCNTNTRDNSELGAKLRRLKIEENVLTENLNKIISVGPKIDGEVSSVHGITNSEFRKFAVAVNKSYNDLKLLFEDIKACTSSKDIIMSVDIDDLKKNTHNLENNIKSFKLYLHKELSNLKTGETELKLKLNDPSSESHVRARPKTQTTKYIEFMSSPVKVAMNSPFKCSEVQAFQEFMSHSKNRYGGWAEYYHNIFVNIWQKYLDTEYSTFSDETMSNITNSTEFKSFTYELLLKVQGVSVEEIVSHARWYKTYLHLKNRQQEAIDKWRSIKRFMKPNMENNVKVALSPKNRVTKAKKLTNNRDHFNHGNEIDNRNKTGYYSRKCLSDKIQQKSTSIPRLNINQDDQLPNFLKSTKQWSVRKLSNEVKSVNELSSIENISKLRVPLWRARL